MQRYHRQMNLADIGQAGQKQLACARVLCIGAGGLGCPALQYLAGAGIGTLGIVDFDNVETSNLHRQILFRMDQIGKNKALAAKETLEALNPDITIHAYTKKLDTSNALELFADYDIILDGSDNFRTKFLVNDAALKSKKPFIFGSALEYSGQAALFNTRDDSPCYRCLFPDTPQQNIQNCAEAGVVGAVTGMIGSLMAFEAIKFFIDDLKTSSLDGKLFTFDGKILQQNILSLHKNPQCNTCQKAPDQIKLGSRITILSTEKTQAYIQATPSCLLIDVRENSEFTLGHIENAQNIPLSSIIENAQNALKEIAHDASILLYCQKGFRSQQAAEILQKNGYENVISIDGGYEKFCSTLM